MSCALRSNKISMNFNFRVDDLRDNDTKKFVDLLETFSLFKRFCLAPLIYRAIPTTTLLISDHSDHLGEWGRVRGGGEQQVEIPASTHRCLTCLLFFCHLHHLSLSINYYSFMFLLFAISYFLAASFNAFKFSLLFRN